MKSLRITGLLIAVLVLSYLGLCAVLPSKIEVSLQKQVYARPEAVFYQLVCFKRWENWLAQKKLAPDTKFTCKTSNCWIGAEVELESSAFGSERYQIDTLQTDSFLRAIVESSQFLNGSLSYNLDSLGQSTIVQLEFTSSEIPFVKRPLTKVSLGSGEEMLRQSLKALKREAELNLLEKVHLYDFECPVNEVHIEEFTVAEIVAEIKMSQFPEFIDKSQKVFEELEKQDDFTFGSTHYFFVLDSLSQGFKVSYGRKIDETTFKGSAVNVRTIQETPALESVKTGKSDLFTRNLALKQYNDAHNFGGRFKQWYEFDSSVDATEAMEMQPDRIIFPKSLIE